jgi:hypothetical protein
MNLFVLDQNPRKAAEQNCDKHVCKIILEAADCLCLAHWNTNGLPKNAPKLLTEPHERINKKGQKRITYKYRPRTQENNHVAIWVRTTLGNYRWTAKHALALCEEYTKRYKRTHATQEILEWLSNNEPVLPTGRTPFRQAVAEDCKGDDVVLAYRLYYLHYKSYFAKWKCGAPSWFDEALQFLEQGRPIQKIVAFLKTA